MTATALLAGLVDYAGLFPPAALSMDEAVAEYARWRRSPEAWMLGRFVLPAARLVEFSRAADAHLPEPGANEPWRLSALPGADVHGDSSLVTSFNRSHAGRAAVDAVELKAGSAEEADAALEALPAGLHHPVRAEHPLTYEPGGPRAVMHGFLNVFAAAAFGAGGGPSLARSACPRKPAPPG